MLNYIAIVIFLTLSAFFSSSEIAYASAGELRLRHSAENSGSLSARLAHRIHTDFDKALATILIGNNLVNIACSSLATVIVIELFGERMAPFATIVITVIVLIFGEIIPKVLAKLLPEKFARAYAIPMYGLMIITAPAVFVINGILHFLSRLWKRRIDDDTPAVTEDELETIIDTVEDEGVIDEDKCELIQSAFDFEGVQAYEIITPRVDMLAIDIDEPRDEIIKTVFESRYSRIPVYRDTIDNIIGILHVNAILALLAENKEVDIRAAMLPPVFVYKTTPLDDVLSKMRRQKSHMAVVTDEYGGVMGILTMEDVLEQLVGDIWDESDIIEPEILRMSDGSFEADGDMRIEDLFDEIGFDDKDFDDDSATIGGFAVELLGRYASKGDIAYYENIKFTVLKVKKHRVTRLKIELLPDSKENISQ